MKRLLSFISLCTFTLGSFAQTNKEQLALNVLKSEYIDPLSL